MSRRWGCAMHSLKPKDFIFVGGWKLDGKVCFDSCGASVIQSLSVDAGKCQ